MIAFVLFPLQTKQQTTTEEEKNKREREKNIERWSINGHRRFFSLPFVECDNLLVLEKQNMNKNEIDEK